MLLRANSLLFAVTSALVLAGCSEDQVRSVDEEVDAGGIFCPTGQVARFGQCFCQTDSGCPEGQYCEAVTGTCRPKEAQNLPDAGEKLCTNGAMRCAPAPKKAVQTCEAGAWVDVETCPEEGFCATSATGYYCAVCMPGKVRCKGDHAIELCDEQGDAWTEEACLNDPETGLPSKCVDDRCQVCTPGTERCSADGKKLETCLADGSGWTARYCPVTGKCEVRAEGDAGTKAACVAPFCMPGDRRCKDGFVLEECKDDGSAFVEKDCRTFDQYATPAAVCAQNTCIDPCGQAARDSSYQGCEYWANVGPNPAGLDHQLFTGGANDGTQPNSTSEYAIVVSNPNTVDVKVKVTRRVGTSVSTSPSNPAPNANGEIVIAAGKLQIIRLPWQTIVGTGRAAYGYRLTSNLPVTAYQFSPVVAYTGSSMKYDWTGTCTNCSYSNDASLLLPAHILSTSYVVVAQEHIKDTSSGVPYPGYFTIVATEDNTVVSVKFAAKTIASRSGVSVAAQEKGSSASYTLSRFEVLQFLSDANGSPLECGSSMCRYSSDPTGSIVISDKPVAVFGGAECTFKPFNKMACDHIEEQMLPFNTWGKSYAGTKTVVYKDDTGRPISGASASPDYWRIVAGCGATSCPNGTTVTITPAPNRVINGTCNATGCTLPPINTANPTAAWVEFTHGGDFTVSADQPIMLAQYLTGQSANGDAAEGDPALILTPPSDQWRKSYNVLTSPTLKHNYLSLVTQSGTPGIKINGKDLNASNFPGLQTSSIFGGFMVLRVPVAGGAQQISSLAKVGVTVYGYDSYVSYGYTGGLDLIKITQILPGG